MAVAVASCIALAQNAQAIRSVSEWCHLKLTSDTQCYHFILVVVQAVNGWRRALHLATSHFSIYFDSEVDAHTDSLHVFCSLSVIVWMAGGVSKVLCHGFLNRNIHRDDGHRFSFPVAHANCEFQHLSLCARLTKANKANEPTNANHLWL